MDLGAIILSIVFCITILACGLMLFVVVRHDDMTDKERERYGLGPPGQGRR